MNGPPNTTIHLLTGEACGRDESKNPVSVSVPEVQAEERAGNANDTQRRRSFADDAFAKNEYWSSFEVMRC